MPEIEPQPELESILPGGTLADGDSFVRPKAQMIERWLVYGLGVLGTLPWVGSYIDEGRWPFHDSRFGLEIGVFFLFSCALFLLYRSFDASSRVQSKLAELQSRNQMLIDRTDAFLEEIGRKNSESYSKTSID